MNSEKNKMEEEIKKSLEILRGGGIILYPTDTIWGIGCDATNEKAVEKIFNVKKRDDSKSMIILIANESMLQAYIERVPEQAWELIEYSSKPLTLVLLGARNVAKNLIASDGSIGIRITKDEFCKRLIEKLRKPIVSTSANISGEPSPQNFLEISETIKTNVDYIVNLHRDENEKKFPSQIIQLGENAEIKILRK